MSSFENRIKKELESEGWEVYHSGAPDFLCMKTGGYDAKTKNYKIEDIKFVEVKSINDDLSKTQKKWRDALVSKRCKYELVKEKTEKKKVEKEKGMCIYCGKHSIDLYDEKGNKKIGRKEKYCNECKKIVDREKNKKLIKHKRSLGTGSLLENKSEDFYKEFFAIQEEKNRLGFEKTECSFCGCQNILIDEKTKEVYCANCLGILGYKCGEEVSEDSLIRPGRDYC